ncbi:MAG TPA: FHA domain-containing protein, partial [Tepidisphaeraceae bacterium]|nr:FHA domain-containing protein [Tepidisphaeraceae bacterium]
MSRAPLSPQVVGSLPVFKVIPVAAPGAAGTGTDARVGDGADAGADHARSGSKASQKKHPPVALDRAVCVIGRQERANLPLPAPQVSKVHALVVRGRGGVYLRDLASRNGVEVNGEPVREAGLCDADVVRIGAYLLRCASGFSRDPGAGAGADGAIALDGDGHARTDAAAATRAAPPALSAPSASRPSPRSSPDAAPAPAPARAHDDAAANAQWIRGELRTADARFPFPRGRQTLLIGRRTGCEVRLEDPTVAPVHAVLFRLDDRWHVQDLAGAGDTAVNGRAVHRQPLAPGDELRVGNISMRYAPLDEAAAAADDEEPATDDADAAAPTATAARRPRHDHAMAAADADASADATTEDLVPVDADDTAPDDLRSGDLVALEVDAKDLVADDEDDGEAPIELHAADADDEAAIELPAEDSVDEALMDMDTDVATVARGASDSIDIADEADARGNGELSLAVELRDGDSDADADPADEGRGARDDSPMELAGDSFIAPAPTSPSAAAEPAAAPEAREDADLVPLSTNRPRASAPAFAPLGAAGGEGGAVRFASPSGNGDIDGDAGLAAFVEAPRAAAASSSPPPSDPPSDTITVEHPEPAEADDGHHFEGEVVEPPGVAIDWSAAVEEPAPADFMAAWPDDAADPSLSFDGEGDADDPGSARATVDAELDRALPPAGSEAAETAGPTSAGGANVEEIAAAAQAAA